MKSAAALLSGVAATVLLSANGTQAGAWGQPKGKGQVILKGEQITADEAFDPDGQRVPLAVERRDATTGIFAEYGVTDRLTLQFKGDWQDGEDQFADYEGRGPAEIAAVWQAWRGERGAVSVQLGYSQPGEGRNAGYEPPGEGAGDTEIRLAGGWSFNADQPRPRWRSWLLPSRSFVEVQVARRFRGGLADEVRADVTFGRHIGRNWLLLNQTYAGQTDGQAVRWLNSETSLVRHFGHWSLQAGWRAAVTGRETPIGQGPVIGLWRRF